MNFFVSNKAKKELKWPFCCHYGSGSPITTVSLKVPAL
jgi:hypothetical protein